MKILALETSTDACSVAVRVDGRTLERHETGARRHASLIMGMVNGLLNEAGLGVAALDVVAVGHGPGSFTGVRIALSVGQGVALAADLPMIGVSSLAALAQRGLGNHAVDDVVVAQDARMGEIYLGRYRRGPAGLAVAVAPDALVAPRPLQIGQHTLLMGSGPAAYPGLAGGQSAIDTETLPHAADVAALAAGAGASQFVAPERIEPVYLRHRVAHAGRADGDPGA